MNALIKLIEDRGLSEQYRALCITIGALVIVASCFWYGSKLHLTRKQRLLSLLIAYPFLMGLLELSSMVSGYLASINFLGINTSTYSGIKVFVFLPLISMIVSKLLRVEWERIADLFAVIRLAEYPVSTLGCLFTGCCRGYPCEWGVYSPATGENYFPVQILNAIIMLLIIVVLLRRAKRLEYKADGKQLPLMLILVGSTRILTEFLMDSEKLVLELSVIAIHCVLTLIVGILLLCIISKRQSKKVFVQWGREV